MPLDLAAIFEKERPNGLSCYGWPGVALFFRSQHELGLPRDQFLEALKAPERHAFIEMHIKAMAERLDNAPYAGLC